MNIGSIGSNNYTSSLMSTRSALNTSTTQELQSSSTTTQATDTLEISDEAKALASNFEELLNSEEIQGQHKGPKGPPPKDGQHPPKDGEGKMGPPPKDGAGGPPPKDGAGGPPPKDGVGGPPPMQQSQEVSSSEETDISAISSQMTSFSSFMKALNLNASDTSTLNMFM